MDRCNLPESFRRDLQEPRYNGQRIGAGNLKSALVNPERQIIVDALEGNGWNRQETARMLGINRTTLYKKMKKFQIEYETHAQLT